MKYISTILFVMYIIGSLFMGIEFIKQNNYWTGFSLKSIVISLIALFIISILPALLFLIAGGWIESVTGSETLSLFVIILLFIAYTFGMGNYVLSEMLGFPVGEKINEIFNRIWNFNFF